MIVHHCNTNEARDKPVEPVSLQCYYATTYYHCSRNQIIATRRSFTANANIIFSIVFDVPCNLSSTIASKHDKKQSLCIAHSRHVCLHGARLKAICIHVVSTADTMSRCFSVDAQQESWCLTSHPCQMSTLMSQP